MEHITPNIKVTGLYIYPVKSLAGISLETSDVDNMGLKYDRRWMLVSPEGRFLTQRTMPQMALVKTSISDDGQLTLNMEGRTSHKVPTTGNHSEKMDVIIWKDNLTVSKVGKDSDTWLSEALGVKCHLVYIEDDVIRQCDLDFAEEGELTGFADGFPMLFVSEASLADLNQKLDQAVDMRRFRPNVVVTGCDAFTEDNFETFTVNNIPMKGVKPCSRCPMPMVDPDKGERTSQEPIVTLMTYRKWNNKTHFGMNVIQKEQGSINVGDELIF